MMLLSKISPTLLLGLVRWDVYEGMLSFWGWFGEVWGIFPGYVGKIIDPWDGNADLYFPLVNGGHV